MVHQKKQLDVSRINKTGWRSKINLKDGIKMTLEDFKKNHLEKKLKEM